MVRRHLLAPSRCPYSRDIASDGNNDSVQQFDSSRVVFPMPGRMPSMAPPPQQQHMEFDDSRLKMPPPPPPPPPVGFDQHPFFRRPLTGPEEEDEGDDGERQKGQLQDPVLGRK